MPRKSPEKKLSLLSERILAEPSAENQSETESELRPEKWYELMNERADLSARLAGLGEQWPGSSQEEKPQGFGASARLKRRLLKIEQQLQDIEIDLGDASAGRDLQAEFNQIADNDEKFSLMLAELQKLKQQQDEEVAQEYAIISEGKRSKKGLLKADREALQDIRQEQLDLSRQEQFLESSPDTALFYRLATLEIYRQALQNKNFVETPSRQKLVERIKFHIENSEPILLEGETGTGKTELALNLCRKLYGHEPEFISGSPDVRASDLLVKQGLRASETADKNKREELSKEIFEHVEQYRQRHPEASEMDIARENDNYARLVAASAGVTPETYFVYGPLVRAMAEGLPLIIDEANLIEPRLRMVLKRIYNAKPGDKIALAGDGQAEVAPGFGLIFTANLKSEKHTERFDFDEAEKRVMINSTIHVDYLPQEELYDLLLAKSMDSQGEAPLSASEAGITLKNFCDAVADIQTAYRDRPSEVYAPKDARGKQQEFKEGVLDPGAALRMLNGLEAKNPDESLVDFLNRSVLNYAANRNYNPKDRELIAKIFMSKGFLQNTAAKELEIPGLAENDLEPFKSQAVRNAAEAVPEQTKELNRWQLAELDPYGQRKLANQKIGEGFLDLASAGVEDQGDNQEIIESGDTLSYSELLKWLQTASTKDGRNLESKLEGGSLEALVQRQESFYQERYGSAFRLDRRKIRLETSRLPAIATGLETGAVNYPLLVATPETLNSAEQKQTAAEFAYRRLLEPLKAQDLKIWAETGADRWTGLTLNEVLQGYIPVELSDFDLQKLQADWQKEIKRVIGVKKRAPQVKPGQVRLVFTDCRQDAPKDQKPINQRGQEVENKYSFIEMIKAQVQVLTPQEWITLAAQSYAKDKTYLSRSAWDWLMAVLDHQGKTANVNNPPISAAVADSNDVGVNLNSDRADGDGDNGRWRCSL